MSNVRTIVASSFIAAFLASGLCHSSTNNSTQSIVTKIQVHSDILVECYFTVRVLADSSFGIIASSPRSCGAINNSTGTIIIRNVDVNCPEHFENIGVPRGGPVGSNGGDIYYKAHGICRRTYFLPI